MKAEQKCKLASSAIVTTELMIMMIVITWLIVTHKPSSMKTSVDLSNQRIEVNCTFYDECTNGD